MSTNHDADSRRVIGFVCLGLDNKDEHQRLTHSEHFLLIGGSEQTHEHMQETAIKFTEALERRGKALPETPVPEVIEILKEAQE